MTLFDISSANRRYALELAEYANVSIQYELGDFIDRSKQHPHQYDYLFMELGVLYYFFEVNAFTKSLNGLLKSLGVVVLHEFHPLPKKALEYSKSDVVVRGDYFSTDSESAETPYTVFLENEVVPECRLRRWNLGGDCYRICQRRVPHQKSC